jgi:ribosome maturation factor RimP
MIDSGKIEEHLKVILAEEDCFLVNIKVDNKNRILIQVDREEGLSIDNCVRISKELESRLDRDTEDFALEVSSPGLDSPFKVVEQYNKSKGQEVRVVLMDGNTIEGVLSEVSDTGIEIESKRTKSGILRFDEIKSTRRIIRLKN